MLQYSMAERLVSPTLKSLCCKHWRWRMDTMNFGCHFGPKCSMVGTVQLASVLSAPACPAFCIGYWCWSVASYGWFRRMVASLCIPSKNARKQV